MIFNSVKDRSNWIDTISKLPIDYQDIYFHPDYVTLNCFKNNSTGFLFCNKEMDKIWVNPFIKIKVPSFNNLLGEVYFDLETPYGYGGPISNTTDQNFILRSNLKFSKWVKSNILPLSKIPYRVKKSPKEKLNFETRLKICGYTKEDFKTIILPMCNNGKEAIGSMGTDTPLAVLSKKPQLI